MIDRQEHAKKLLVTSESGRLIEFDTQSFQHKVLYRHPTGESLFGITWENKNVYLTGGTFVAHGQYNDDGFSLVDMRTPFKPKSRGWVRRALRSFWKRMGVRPPVTGYDLPGLHQLNQYEELLYVAATSWNEIWVLDLDLQLKDQIPIQPHLLDYYHLNNVFCGGTHFYVCLNRYAGQPGLGGYAKFDLSWNEVERRATGWESHALSLIDGQVIQLCCYSWRSATKSHIPQRAGLMVNDKFVFDYDVQKYFCKDFSMDASNVYIVGGGNTKRDQRPLAVGVVFVLNKKFEVIHQLEIAGFGGFNGCRLQGTDYSKGYNPIDQGVGVHRRQLI